MTPFVLFADEQPPVAISTQDDRIRIAVGDVSALVSIAEARMIAGALAGFAALRPVPDGAA